MDKYEYKVKTEQLLELMREGSYRKAAEIADAIDWKRVRNASMLANVSEVYEKNHEYDKSYQVLNLAYHRAEGSRKIISKLCTLALKTGNVDEAIDYYDDFMQVAPKDPNQYILRYQILHAQKAPIEQQIEALEEYKKSEYIEEWAYELAKLYQQAGMTAECLEECDDLILWFSEGQYVYKAMELKMQYKPLTPSQQEKYDKRYEKLNGETEEMPDVTAYAAAKAEEEDGEAADAEAEGETVQKPSDAETLSDSGDGAVTADVNDAASAGETAAVAAAAVPHRKKIGDTMPLDEALRKLLHPEAEEKKEKSDDEPELDDLEQAMGEIEAVADVDMVRQIAEKKKKKMSASSKGEMTEIIPEESLTEEMPAADEVEAFLEAEEAEELVLEADDADDIPEPDNAEEMPAADEAEAETEIIEEGTAEGESMADQKTKKIEPILPPDIQRMIDEIEGVIPEEEEKPAPVKKAKVEEPHENMGKVAESLRIDGDSDDWDEAEEEFDEREEFFDVDEEELDEGEEYLDEDEEEFDEGEEYLDAEEEEFDEGEEYFDEDEEEFEEGEEYFDEDEEESEEGEEYFDEDEEEFEEGEEYFNEEEEESDEGEEYFAEDGEEFEEADDEIADWDEDVETEYDEADEIDDREIPDEEDDNMDILSATTPLSRKETAKMIATGKTAPLPLDEISDALSMSDTGFIVHGRYDLGVQSGIGTRAGLTEEQKKLFSYFVPVRGMSEQLVDVLEQDKNCTNRQGTSRTGNLLIVGNKGNGKTVLAVDVVKAIQKQRNIHQGKVAIVTGDSLNKKKIGDIFEKLYGGALIIEKAGKMNEKTVARLNKAMERDTGELLIVLEEQRKPIDRLLSSNREFRRKFTSRLEVPIFINDELVTFGQTYAQENGYRIDEMGILALYSRIDSLQREDHAVTVAEVKEIMDEAIQHSQKASAKKLVKRVFGRNTDDADRIILSEKDFNI